MANQSMKSPLGYSWRVLVKIALQSALNRRYTLSLVVFVIAISCTLLLTVERVRQDARTSFSQSIAGTDLIIGARTSPIQLMLYSVFRIGDASNNIRWESYQSIARHPAIAWTVPISLGDSHRGFPVLGTSAAYFEHLRYGQQQKLRLRAGSFFQDGADHVFGAVIGAEIAQQLSYQINDEITLSHGMDAQQALEHADKAFRVIGILERTGTPVDRTVHVNLQAIEALHLDWQAGAPIPQFSIAAEHVRKFDLEPQQITAALIGLKNRSAVFRVQRSINNFGEEALLAVIPGVALDELWQMLSQVEQLLFGIAALVGLISFCSLIAVISASLNERRRELAILRAVGASPVHIAILLLVESAMLSLIGIACGVLLVDLLSLLGSAHLQNHFGISLQLSLIRSSEIGSLALLLGAGLLAGMIPAWRAYRYTLNDGLSNRL
ncbi:ABC transporter permease [Undibacterium baiyunense]|nr:FtsX-like permease family protein [Undibacterium baiyunense]